MNPSPSPSPNPNPNLHAEHARPNMNPSPSPSPSPNPNPNLHAEHGRLSGLELEAVREGGGELEPLQQAEDEQRPDLLHGL